MIEYVNHVHDMFVTPIVVARGRYGAPTTPGFSSEMREKAVREPGYPHGSVWAEINAGGNN